MSNFEEVTDKDVIELIDDIIEKDFSNLTGCIIVPVFFQ